MKTLSIIAAACLSGAAYGQSYETMTQRYLREGQEQLQQIQAQEFERHQQEQLDELAARQRWQQYCPLPEWNPWAAMEQRRIERNRETYLRHYLEDCE
jgi:hypothetical protein